MPGDSEEEFRLLLHRLFPSLPLPSVAFTRETECKALFFGCSFTCAGINRLDAKNLLYQQLSSFLKSTVASYLNDGPLTAPANRLPEAAASHHRAEPKAATGQDAISRLFHHCQKHKATPPEFLFAQENGLHGCTINYNSLQVSVPVSFSKRALAKEEAARNMLEVLSQM